MSLPNNTVSAEAVISDFLYPDSLEFDPFLSYDTGGVDIQDSTQGSHTFIWYAQYKDKNITVNRDPSKKYVIKDYIENVNSIDFSFDQNLKPIVCWDVDSVSTLYWFDATINNYRTSTFSDCRDPRLTLDDKREVMLTDSDVLFAYIKTNGDLCYRQQRDRFSIERVLKSGIPEDVRLEKIGMTVGNRILFKTSKKTILPTCSI